MDFRAGAADGFVDVPNEPGDADAAGGGLAGTPASQDPRGAASEAGAGAYGGGDVSGGTAATGHEGQASGVGGAGGEQSVGGEVETSAGGVTAAPGSTGDESDAGTGGATAGMTGEEHGGLAGWVLDGYGISGRDAAATSRGLGLLDLLTVAASGDISFYRYDGMWHPAVKLRSPAGVVFGAVAAVTDRGGVAVIGLGSDQSVYYAHSMSGQGEVTFGAWSQVPGAIASGGADSIALVEWYGGGRLDAFWLTPAGNIGHAWGIDLGDGTESGDDASRTYLQPTSQPHALNAVTTGPNRLDIFLDAADPSVVQHHWYAPDSGQWGSDGELHREQLTCWVNSAAGKRLFEATGDFAVLSDGAGTFDLFVLDVLAPNGLALAHAHGTTGMSPSTDAGLVFDEIGASVPRPDRLVEAVAWNDGASRNDVFGIYANSWSIWQFIAYP